MSESTHVAEFFETTLCLSIPLLLISQIMAYRYALWEPIERIAELEHEDFERWLENEKEYRGETNNDPDALPNSVDRNIKEELNPSTDPVDSEPKDIALDERRESQDSQQRRTSSIQQNQQVVIEVANQSTPISYPIEQKPYLKLYLDTNLIFGEYIPVIMVSVTLGILVESTYILSMMCFFGYLFVNLLFNYAQLFEKLATKTESPLTPQIISNLAGLFMVAYFLGLLIRTQYI